MFDANNLNTIQNNAGLPPMPATIGSFITSSNIMGYLFGAAGIILLIMIITAGYQIMFSKGDPKSLQIAQSKLTTSAVGLILLFSAFWIVRIVGQFLGISVFDQVFN